MLRGYYVFINLMSRQGLFGLSILPILWESIMENPILIAGHPGAAI